MAGASGEVYSGWFRAESQNDKALTCFRRRLLFLFDPFLEAAFQNTPLSADFKRGDLTVLDHAVKRSFGDFQNARRLGQSEKSNRALWFLDHCVLLKASNMSKRYARERREAKF